MYTPKTRSEASSTSLTARPQHLCRGIVMPLFAAACSIASTAALAAPTYDLTIYSPSPGTQILNSPTPVSSSLTATSAAGFTASTSAAAGSGYLRGSSHATLDLPQGSIVSASGFSQEYSDFYLDGIQIVGPAGSTPNDIVQYTVNVNISGSIGASAPVASSFYASAAADLRFGTNSSLGGFGGAYVGSISVDAAGNVTASGIFGGFPTTSPGTASGTSPVWSARAGDLISISMILDTSAVAGESFGSGPGLADAFADFSHTASFATSGPVFNLPTGWTVNSLDGCIVDNQYQCAPATVPLPAAAWLFGSGLLGLIGVARRKKASDCVEILLRNA